MRVRNARRDDVGRLVEIEFDRYADNHGRLATPRDAIRSRFERRLSRLSDWSWVVVVGGRVEGWVSGMLTPSAPSDVNSWERTTAYGTGATHDPDGDNVYVINLDVTRTGTRVGGQYALMGAIGEKTIRTGARGVTFLSRMPGLSAWVSQRSNGDGPPTGDALDALARQYAASTTMGDGGQVRRDPLLRFYEESGFTVGEVIPDAFTDPESLHYGVLCTGDNPVPRTLRRVRPVAAAVGRAFALASRQPRLLEKLVG